MKNPHKSPHTWQMVKVEEGVRESRIAGIAGTPYVASSWICHCGQTKLVVRPVTDQTPPDDPQHLVTPEPPAPLRP